MDDVSAFHLWLNRKQDNEMLYWDTETTGLKPEVDHVRLVQIGDERDGWAMSWARWSGVFEDVVRKHTGRWGGHNAPFDWQFCHQAGITMDRTRVDDTRPMAHIVDPVMSTALKRQAARYVDPRAGNAQTDLDDALGKNGGWTWATIPVTFDPYWSYAALDPVLTAQLDAHHRPIVMAQAPRAYEIENTVQWITHDMERSGVHIDVEYAKLNRAKFDKYCREVDSWCQLEYNVKPGSNAAVIAVLEREGVQFFKATKSGAVALDKDVLEGIDHPLARQVLQRRQLQKISSTYLSHYVDDVDADNLLHPSINTLGARTSRMSMSDPNLQNLPRRNERNPAATVVRNCIIARPGHTLLLCDFSQIEMRMLAWLSQSPALLEAFMGEDDFFVNLARQVFLDDTITKDSPLRGRIKNVGYAKIYGAGVTKLALTAGISVQQVRETLAGFDNSAPEVRVFQDLTYREAMQRRSSEGRGYTLCPLTGRRHYSDPGKEYALVNFKIQGGAAALFKMKVIELEQAGLAPYLVALVHDEVVLDVPNNLVPDAVNTLQRVMNDATVLAPVPVTAEVSFGQRWGEKRDWNLDAWRESIK
jgi:DNA polymerase-1